MKKLFSLMMTALLIWAVTVCNAAEKKSDEIQFDEKKLRDTKLIDAGAKGIPVIVLRERLEDITLMGEPVVTQQQMVNFIKRRNPKPKLNCSVEHIVRFYYAEAGREGIRPDVAICQAIKETGTWNYGGDVSPKQNNFCGLGATGNKEPGATFITPKTGVRAHIQHLLAYATTEHPKVKIVDPRYELIEKWRPQIFGKIKTWTGLNGVWAVPGNQYGQDILNLWLQAQSPDGSKQSLEKANQQLAENDDKASAYVYRGLVYFSQKDFAKAAEDFKSALEVDSELSAAWLNLALTYEKLNQIDEAISAYDEFLKLDPKSELGHYNRGHLKLSQNKFDEAIEDFHRTLEIEDRFVDAHNEIAIAYFRQQKYLEALKEIQFAAKVNTTNKVINANKEKLEACVKK